VDFPARLRAPPNGRLPACTLGIKTSYRKRPATESQNVTMDASNPPADEPKDGTAPATLARDFDTTGGSVIHALSDRLLLRFGKRFARIKLYGLALVIAFIPLFIVAATTGPASVSLFHPAGSIKLPFFYDANSLFMYLVSFPCLIVLAATDQQTLTKALKTVITDGTVEISAAQQIELADRWSRSFWYYNVAAQLIGVAIAAAVAGFNYEAYVLESPGLWITYDGKMLPVAYVYMYCIWIFYTVVAIYVFRSVLIALLLRDIVRKAELHMLPFHPDKAGGLRPVGHLGLRNQYALTIFGVNVVALLLVNQYLTKNEFLIGLMIAAIVAYLVVGPFVFVAALLPFRSAMRDNKDRLMKTMALRMRRELDRLHRQLPKDPITKEDEELIDRLRKVGAVIDELPVWPFDALTLRKFVTAYFIPIASAAYPVAKAIIGHLMK
jgi:hypothetical protein